MSNNNQSQRPMYRISFARITGRDDKGKDILGSAREIGAVWKRRGSNAGIIRLDHMPIELTRHNGVLFLNPVDQPS